MQRNRLKRRGRTHDYRPTLLGEALALNQKHITTGHLLLAVAEESDGAAAAIMREHQITKARVVDALARELGKDWASVETTPPREMRHAIDLAWLDGIGTGLNRWGVEIRDGLSREPDAGDLLLVLSCSEGLVAETFRQLGADPERIRDAVKAARLGRAAREQDIRNEIENLREEKQHALECQEAALAAELRERERKLWDELRGEHVSQHDVFSAVRQHLGLPPRPGEPW